MIALSPRERPKVLVSYARNDSQFALNLARDLRKAGANLWVDQFDTPAGPLGYGRTSGAERLPLLVRHSSAMCGRFGKRHG
jgi:hypothetical protein